MLEDILFYGVSLCVLYILLCAYTYVQYTYASANISIFYVRYMYIIVYLCACKLCHKLMYGRNILPL